MTTLTALNVDSKTDLKTVISTVYSVNVVEYNEIISALSIDPKSIREKVIESKEVLLAISEAIVTVGPKPDKTLARLSKRSNIPVITINKVRTKVQTIMAFISKYAIKGTQFQAAFPDYIWKVRRDLLDAGAVLQRFCSEIVLPIEFQFPGSGPILPFNYRTMEHYGAFCEALTKALSQGQQEVNWLIAKKSIQWVVEINDRRFTGKYAAPKEDDIGAHEFDLEVRTEVLSGSSSSSSSSSLSSSSSEQKKKEKKKQQQSQEQK
jgi:hypothetical protein